MAVVHMKRLPASVDYASCSFNQQNRLLKYEVWREMGVDNYDAELPWSFPVQATMRVRQDSVDADTWALLKAIHCGQRVTLDSSISFEWAGEYEVVERRLFPQVGDGGAAAGSATLFHAASQDAGQIELLLRTYSEAPMTDQSDTPTFATVPGTAWWFS